MHYWYLCLAVSGGERSVQSRLGTTLSSRIRICAFSTGPSYVRLCLAVKLAEEVHNTGEDNQ